MHDGEHRFSVIGPLRVVDPDGCDVAPVGALQRRLLAALLLHRGHVVSTDRLGELLWGDDHLDASAALHSHVSRLRHRIPGLDIGYVAPGYLVEVDESSLDVCRFEALVTDGCARVANDPAASVAGLDAALELWRGDPYLDLIDADDGRIERDRLGELRARAVDARFEAQLLLGRAVDVLAEIEAAVARDLLREQTRSLLMRALSDTGRRAEALRVYDGYRRVLAAELGVAPSPSLRRQHDELLALDDVVAVGPPTARGVLPPRPVSSLVGRGELLGDLAHRLGRARLVTLVGPGGVGKTRLALELAHDTVESFPDGTYFCDLSAVPAGDGADGVAIALCAALGVETRVGTPTADRIAEVLRTERALVVVDNCEHVLDEAANLIEPVLRSTERLTVLATSRERLAVDGEVLCHVDPLACREGAGSDADGPASPAVDLFRQRAQAVTTAELDDSLVDDICRRLDGLPLAVELAATRLRSLTLLEIRDGLDHSMAMLRGGRRTVARHRSLDAALEWSYRLLSPIERESLHAASMFVAPFGADDAAAMLGRSADDARERMVDLVERSLLQRSAERFTMLETLRQFTREHLDELARRSLLHRHAAHLADRADSCSADLRTAVGDGPIAEVRRLAPDLRQAIRTALDQTDADLAVRLVDGTRDAALNGMLPGLMLWGQEVGELAATVDHPLTADVMAIASVGRWKVGDIDEMSRLLDRADAEAERLRLGDRYEVWGARGTEELARGRLTEAIRSLDRSLATQEARDDVHRLAEGGATAAICRSYAHDPAARSDARRLVDDVAPRSGDVPASWCWYAAGECELEAAPDDAARLLAHAVELARRSGATFVEGVAGASLASVDVRAGRLVDAIARYRWLIPLWMRAGVRAPFWTMMRTVVELLVVGGADVAGARLLGAVTSPHGVNEVAGDDAQRLVELARRLESRLGAERFVACRRAGDELDDADAAAEALAAFELIV